ncbi:hypothetical protein [Nostoc sp. LEGE 12447]|nr:hypothetical protein [Nostoc sp. LEGE 12447]MBE9000604.1 hypothetical protein [Nostoc sp. LEGE 12447]
MSTTGYAYAWNPEFNTQLPDQKFIETEFRSQEPEWAKRPASANRMNFV